MFVNSKMNVNQFEQIDILMQYEPVKFRSIFPNNFHFHSEKNRLLVQIITTLAYQCENCISCCFSYGIIETSLASYGLGAALLIHFGMPARVVSPQDQRNTVMLLLS